MKKQLLFLSLILVFVSHNLCAQQLIQALQTTANQSLQAQLKAKLDAQAQLRKALLVRGSFTVALTAATVALGVIYFKHAPALRMKVPVALPVAPPPPPPSSWSSWVSWRSAPVQIAPPLPPPIVLPAATPDYVGTAKVVGLAGSAWGLFKNIGPFWQQFMQFGSLKRDTNALLVLQKETLDGQRQLGIAQAVTQQMIEAKDKRDDARWQEQKKILDGLYTKIDEAKDALKKLLEAKLKEQSADISSQIMALNQNILTLTSQVAEILHRMPVSGESKPPAYAK